MAGDWFAGCRRAVALPSRAGRKDRVGGPRGGRLDLGEYSYHQAADPAEQARVLYPDLPRRGRAGLPRREELVQLAAQGRRHRTLQLGGERT